MFKFNKLVKCPEVYLFSVVTVQSPLTIFAELHSCTPLESNENDRFAILVICS